MSLPCKEDVKYGGFANENRSKQHQSDYDITEENIDTEDPQELWLSTKRVLIQLSGEPQRQARQEIDSPLPSTLGTRST